MRLTRRLALPAIIALFLFPLFPPVPAPAENTGRILIYAAASTTNAVTDVCELFNAKGSGRAVPVFASSSTLARQIENGAPAELFLSANLKWMDYLEQKQRIIKSTRKNLLGNRVVVIVPADSAVVPGADLRETLLNQTRQGGLAMGDPDHVPAGMYAREALESLGLMAPLASGIIRAKDVRAALAFVERGEAACGIVYATDAAISERVRVIGVLPENSHRSIRYPVALVRGCKPEPAGDALAFIQSHDALEIFKKYGFSIP